MSLDAALSRITRHVPRFRGWHRLLEPLRRHYVRHYEGRDDRWVVIDDFEGDLKIRLDRSAQMASLIYWRGIHSFSEASLIRRFLPRDGVFLDVGANQGELTLVAARCAPQGRVFAFEPVPQWFALLEENVGLNQMPHVRMVNAALADSEGTHEMFAAPDPDATAGHNEGLSSFHRRSKRDQLMGTFPTFSLDAFAERESLERLDMVKVDVEGAEPLVLSGGYKTLSRHHPTLILEWNPDALAGMGGSGAQMLQQVRALGYDCFEVDPFATIRPLRADEAPHFDTLLARHASRD